MMMFLVGSICGFIVGAYAFSKNFRARINDTMKTAMAKKKSETTEKPKEIK